MASQPSSFIVTLPKAELHLHLEGAIDPTTLLELRQRHGKSSTLSEIEQLYSYQDFNGFLMAFKAVTEDLQTADDYELITYRLMERLRAQNVLHAEVYVSVGVCLWRKQNFDALFEGLERGRQKGERDFGVSLLWIFDAVRQFGAPAAREVFEVAVRYREHGVVAIGMGGDEQKGPPELFRDAYAYAADNGLHLTAHAGENAGPNPSGARSIFARSASVTDLLPRRIRNWWKSWRPARFRWKSALPATCAPALAHR